MAEYLQPKTEILPEAQKQILPQLAPARALEFVLYGGTAVALHLGHRRSLDFDFFRFELLAKDDVEKSFEFMRDAAVVQEAENTLVVNARMPAGPVQVSFFGGMKIGRLNEPVQTRGHGILLASLEDLLATKLKAILDRAETKDYRDIAAMLAAGVSLERALGAFAKMYQRNPGLPLRALGFFSDGDLRTLSSADKEVLRTARDRVGEIPDVTLTPGSLSGRS
jgi:hypothetical protein